MKAILVGLASLLLVTCVFAAEQPNSADSMAVGQVATASDAKEGCEAAPMNVLTDVLGFEPALSTGQEKTSMSGGSCMPSCVNACNATRDACVAGCGANFSCIVACNCAQYWCVDACGCDQDPPPILC